MARIDAGDDPRLGRLAAALHPPGDVGAPPDGAVHPVARLCAARGAAYDTVANPHRALPFLQAALAIDPRCPAALDHVVRRRLLPPGEEAA